MHYRVIMCFSSEAVLCSHLSRCALYCMWDYLSGRHMRQWTRALPVFSLGVPPVEEPIDRRYTPLGVKKGHHGWLCGLVIMRLHSAETVDKSSTHCYCVDSWVVCGDAWCWPGKAMGLGLLQCGSNPSGTTPSPGYVLWCLYNVFCWARLWWIQSYTLWVH